MYMVAEPLPGFTKHALAQWCERRLFPECEVYSDGLACFNEFATAGHAHTTLDAKGRAATEVQGARWVNIVLANVKRGIDGA